MRGALDVHRELLAQDVAHEVVRLRRPVVSADDLPAALDLPAQDCVAVRCYVTDGRTVAVMMHAGAVPDPAALLDALGARSARPATAAEVNAATDCAAGLVSPVGLPSAVLLLIDAAVTGTAPAEDRVLYAAAAEAGVALAIRTGDLLRATGARTATLSGRPLASEDRAGWDGVLEGEPSADEPPGPPAPDRVIHLDERPAGRRPAR